MYYENPIANLNIRRISGCACCSSRSSSANIIWFNCTCWTASKSSSIWPESDLKRRSPGSKKHMLIRSTIVRIRTRRYHFWTSSVLVEQLQVKIHAQKFEEMEWSSRPIGSKANIYYNISRSVNGLWLYSEITW